MKMRRKFLSGIITVSMVVGTMVASPSASATISTRYNNNVLECNATGSTWYFIPDASEVVKKYYDAIHDRAFFLASTTMTADQVSELPIADLRLIGDDWDAVKNSNLKIANLYNEFINVRKTIQAKSNTWVTQEEVNAISIPDNSLIRDISTLTSSEVEDLAIRWATGLSQSDSLTPFLKSVRDSVSSKGMADLLPTTAEGVLAEIDLFKAGCIETASTQGSKDLTSSEWAGIGLLALIPIAAVAGIGKAISDWYNSLTPDERLALLGGYRRDATVIVIR